MMMLRPPNGDESARCCANCDDSATRSTATAAICNSRLSVTSRRRRRRRRLYMKYFFVICYLPLMQDHSVIVSIGVILHRRFADYQPKQDSVTRIRPTHDVISITKNANKHIPPSLKAEFGFKRRLQWFRFSRTIFYYHLTAESLTICRLLT